MVLAEFPSPRMLTSKPLYCDGFLDNSVTLLTEAFWTDGIRRRWLLLILCNRHLIRKSCRFQRRHLDCWDAPNVNELGRVSPYYVRGVADVLCANFRRRLDHRRYNANDWLTPRSRLSARTWTRTTALIIIEALLLDAPCRKLLLLLCRHLRIRYLDYWSVQVGRRSRCYYYPN